MDKPIQSLLDLVVEKEDGSVAKHEERPNSSDTRKSAACTASGVGRVSDLSLTRYAACPSRARATGPRRNRESC